MPSRQSVLMGQNQNNVPEGRGDSNVLEKKPDTSYKPEIPTTQNVDNSKNAPSTSITPEPKKEITMKGIYLTEKGKQELKAKIAEIESYEGLESGMADTLKEILSSATILPVEKTKII